MAAEQGLIIVRAVEGLWCFVLSVVAPTCKVGSLVGIAGKVINEIRDEFGCDIEIPRRFEKDPTVILHGKDMPRLIEAYNRVCRIITSPKVHDNGSDVTALCILTSRDHLKDFTAIAEKFHTAIQIKDDLRISSLPGECVIEVMGHRKDVRITGSILAEYLCKCQLKAEPPFISPLLTSCKITVSDEHTIPVEAAVGYINTWTEIVSAMTIDTSKVLIVEVIGKHKQVDQAIEFLQKSIRDASLSSKENVF